jgi:hypothetical protein
VDCVPNKKADAERYGAGGVGLVFYEVAKDIFAIHGHFFDLLSTIHGSVDRLAVSILHSSSRLVHGAAHFCGTVTGDFPNSFLNFSSDTSNTAGDPIISHGGTPLVSDLPTASSRLSSDANEVTRPGALFALG